MTDRPIIFSGAMVRSLLAGHKTMTRRLAWRSETDTKLMAFVCDGERADRTRLAKNVPAQMAGAYYLRSSPWQRVKPGDRLWVRESLQRFDGSKGVPSVQYMADLTAVPAGEGDARLVTGAAIWNWGRRTLPSIHMPRWASRLTLIVTAAKIECLKSITEDDARAEGMRPGVGGLTHREEFCSLWCTLHGSPSWESNPEVVAISFNVIKENIDRIPKAEAA